MSAEHNDSNSSILKIALNLTATCFICGVIIAGTYFATAPIAAQKAIETTKNTMKALVPQADNFVEVEGKEGWFAAEKGGETVAFVVPSESKGYGGAIKLLVAVSPDGKVLDYSCTKHNETPGLGDKAARSPFKDQFKGKTAELLEVTKDPTNKENIQSLTGATISSKAFTKGVKQAVEEVVEFEGGNADGEE
ncbi:MAG TPA: RnfABCDGE type electron transport complex subunit G [Clostridiaceae bacterium]|nr:RnfABCDGE type electron transport complex subunit G [Clostridiaceae bacterium]